MGIAISNPTLQHQLLESFLSAWPLDRISKMKIDEYTNVKDKSTFTYMLEFGSEDLGVISGRPSNKFGIWHRGRDSQIVGKEFLYDETYAWYRKYGNTAQEAFEQVRSHIVNIIKNAQAGNFSAIDHIDLDSLSKWKIAFLYSGLRLFPAFKKDILRKVAEILGHPNYRKADLSELHTFIMDQKDPQQEFFDFYAHYFNLASQQLDRNYYIIGSKYEDADGNDNVDIFPDMLDKSAISTGFFWGYDFSHLVGKPIDIIYKWIDKNIPATEPKFATARRTLSYFINLKPGDIVAVKSHGQFNNLTVIAYAQVKEVDGKIYEFNDPDIGHLINVDFLETGLYLNTGLTYGQTIHKIIPGERFGHFEKIFGSYAFTNPLSGEIEEDEDIAEDNLKQKDITEYTRSATAAVIVKRVHDSIQNEFSLFLKEKFPQDAVRVEEKYVDVWRNSPDGIFIYEIKPYNSVFSCIRASLGQLMDYAFSLSDGKKHLVSVGVIEPTDADIKFIEFLKKELNLPFYYEYFDRAEMKSQVY